MATYVIRILKNGRKKISAQINTKGIRTSKVFSSTEDAKIWVLEQEKNIHNDGKNSYVESILLSAIIIRFKKDKLQDYRSKSMLHFLSFWNKELGDLDIQTIKPSDIFDVLQQKKSASRHHYLSALSSVFNRCIQGWSILKKNPCQLVHKEKKSEARDRFLSQEEIKELLNQCKKSESNDLYLLVLIAVTTGMRYGEIINIQKKNIEFLTGKTFLKNPKNNEGRSIFLNKESLKLIEIKNNNNIFQQKSFKISFKNACKKINIKDFRFHDLRHSFARHLAMSGANLVEIADILGHKRLNTVKRYAHLVQQDKKEVMQKLSNDLFN